MRWTLEHIFVSSKNDLNQKWTNRTIQYCSDLFLCGTFLSFERKVNLSTSTKRSYKVNDTFILELVYQHTHTHAQNMHLKDPSIANLIIPNATQIVLQHILLYFKTILTYHALLHSKPQCTWYYAFHSRCYPLLSLLIFIFNKFCKCRNNDIQYIKFLWYVIMLVWVYEIIFISINS